MLKRCAFVAEFVTSLTRSRHYKFRCLVRVALQAERYLACVVVLPDHNRVRHLNLSWEPRSSAGRPLVGLTTWRVGLIPTVCSGFARDQREIRRFC